MQTHS